MQNLIRNWTYLVIGGLSVSTGLYLTFHLGYISQVYRYSKLFDWLDTPSGGVFLILTGCLTIVGVAKHLFFLRKIMLILNGCVYAMFFASFLFRDLAGYHNMTWLFALATSFSILGIAYKEAIRTDE